MLELVALLAIAGFAVPTPIELVHGVIDPRTPAGKELERRAHDLSDAKRFFVLQFAEGVGVAQRDLVRSQHGARARWEIIDQRTVVVRSHRSILLRTLRIVGRDLFDFVGLLPAALKLLPSSVGHVADETGRMRLRAVLEASGDEAQRLQSEIAQLGGEVEEFADPILVFQTTAATHARVVEYLAAQDCVFAVEAAPRPAPENKFAAPVSQGTNVAVEPTRRILEERGLTGTGQVIGVVDTGADFHNCLLAESDGSVPPTPPNAVDWKRRKIVFLELTRPFLKPGDDGDHGTHVCGIAAGSCSGCALDGWRGGAPDAQLYVVEGGPNLLFPPQYQNLYQNAVAAGVRLFTNSWGSNTNGEYRTDAAEMDSILYANQSLFMVFSGGNRGMNPTYKSASSPSIAKNVLSVGAAYNPGMGALLDYVCSFSASACRESNGTMTNAELRRQYDGCRAFNERLDAAGWFHAHSLAFFSSYGPTAVPQTLKPEVVTPGSRILSTRNRHPAAGAFCGTQTAPESCNTRADAALVTMEGTSMAAPNAAAAMSLVREYVVTGRYRIPPGDFADAGQSAKIAQPGGALLKAMAISATDQPSDGVWLLDSETTVNITSYPNFHTGYGFLNLSRVLRFADSPFELFLTTAALSETVARREFHFAMVSGGEFRASLVWMDFPGSAMARRPLVHDLDLSVACGGVVYTGNYGLFGLGVRDTVNAHEQVVVVCPPGRIVVAVERRGELVAAEQIFALVATGDFTARCVENCASCWSGGCSACADGFTLTESLLCVE